MPNHHKLTGHARKKNAENKTTQYMYIPFTGGEIQFCNQVKKTKKRTTCLNLRAW